MVSKGQAKPRLGRVLKAKADFDRLRKNGEVVRPSDWLMISYARNELGFLRYGMTFPRYVGSAVVRNRLRRWSREFFRRQDERTEGLSLDINLILRRRPEVFFKELSHEKFDEILAKGVVSVEARSSTSKSH